MFFMSSEFEAIAQLFRKRVPFSHPLTSIGNGDDASVHQLPESSEIVISTDSAVSGIHWPEDMPLAVAGARAVNAALSDLAAMGAEATWLWLAVMAKNSESLQQMSDGIVEACQEHQLELAGGDTVRSPTNAINVTVAGIIPRNKVMSRQGAAIGDEIWILGDLGLSASGLKQWQDGNRQGEYIPYFQQVKPLLSQGIQLRKLGIQCCMDISDGLLQDTGHIAKASQLTMVITLEQLEQLPSCRLLQQNMSQQASLDLMLSGGEDYALLFTAPASLHQSLQQLGAYPIGSCCQGEGVKLQHHGQDIALQYKGYDHFG